MIEYIINIGFPLRMLPNYKQSTAKSLYLIADLVMKEL